jgi:hypothetical protein
MDTHAEGRIASGQVTLESADIERIACRSVAKLMEPINLQLLAEAIATALRNQGIRYMNEGAELGQRLDAGRY